MMMKTKDQLGDRMKMYESHTTQQKLIPKLPVMARLDGHTFSKWTKGLKKPYDKRLSDLMIITTQHLVKKFNCNCAYTQSDEITLTWYFDDPKSQMVFGGKLFKLQSLLATTTSVFFNKHLESYLPEKVETTPEFDCRVWNVPTLNEVVNCFLWREQDAIKNSISMVSQHLYSHKQLHGKNSSQMKKMIQDKGDDWKQYPEFFKRGTYIQRQTKLTKFSTEELKRLPKKHQAHQNPDLLIKRRVVEVLKLPPLLEIDNPVEVIVFGKGPE